MTPFGTRLPAAEIESAWIEQHASRHSKSSPMPVRRERHLDKLCQRVTGKLAADIQKACTARWTVVVVMTSVRRPFCDFSIWSESVEYVSKQFADGRRNVTSLVRVVVISDSRAPLRESAIGHQTMRVHYRLRERFKSASSSRSTEMPSRTSSSSEYSIGEYVAMNGTKSCGITGMASITSRYERVSLLNVAARSF